MERVGVLARAELAGQPRQCADPRREAYHASRVKLPDRLTPGISTWSFVDSVRRVVLHDAVALEERFTMPRPR